MADVVMPQLGETVADGTVAKWFKKVGDTVSRGEPLFEVSTDKVDTEIPASASGLITEILVAEGQTVDVGTILAIISTSDADVASTSVAPAVEMSTATSSPVATLPAGEQSHKLSPVVRRLLAENNLDVNDVMGTGPGGRITKEDVALAVASKKPTTPLTPSPVVRRLLAEHGVAASDVTATGADGRLTRKDVEDFVTASPRVAHAPAGRQGDEVIPFSKIRRLTAEHMVRSKATSAHTLMVKEIDFENVERVRRARGAAFKKELGFSLTYLPFISVATLVALREFPHLNASVGNDELIVHHNLNLGIAVDLDHDGLVVPVLKNADQRGLRDIAISIRDVALRARGKTLGVDDMTGGTFTITNPGPYGTLMTGAVINQPQVAILATDGVSRKPVVITDDHGQESIAIHSVGLVALTFDHRAVDGGYAARFLARLAEILQERAWADDL